MVCWKCFKAWSFLWYNFFLQKLWQSHRSKPVTSLAFTYWPWANSLKFKIWFNDCRIHYFQSWWPLEQNKAWFIQKISLACFNKLHVDCYMYLYLFFKLFFIHLSEKEKAATRQWKSCQKIQGIQILIEYMTHFQCKPVSEIQRICHTTLSLTFSHISQNSSSKKKITFYFILRVSLMYVIQKCLD